MKIKLCRPVLVNCNETPVVGDIVVNRDGEIALLTKNDSKEYAKTTMKQQLILISLDPNEEIREGDLHIRYHNGRAGSHIDDSPIEWCHKHKYRKVIALQEQLSPEYINQFIENYNDVDNDVIIEMVDELWEAKSFDNSYIKGSKERCLNWVESKTYGMKESIKLIEGGVPKLTGRFVTIIDKVTDNPNYDENIVERYRKFLTVERIRMYHDELGELFTRKDVTDMLNAIKMQ